MIEALGVGMPGNAAIPRWTRAVTVLARMAGRRIVELVKHKISVSRILTREAFENAIAPGGDRRIDERGDPSDRPSRAASASIWTSTTFDRLGRGVHTLVNLMPSAST